MKIPNLTRITSQKQTNAFQDVADKVICAESIDGFFDYKLGHLEYDSRRYELEELEQPDFQGQAIVELEDAPSNCSRTIEYKHFTDVKSLKTVVAREYLGEWLLGRLPGPPIGGKRNKKLSQQYKELAKEFPNIIFGGRMGEYKNYSMAEAVATAIEMAR